MENIESIISGCIRNDHKYQKMLYERYRAYGLHVVFRYIYRYDEALDTATDGFVKIFTGFERFTPDPKGRLDVQLLGWMKKIWINVSIDRLRKNELLPEIGGIPPEVWDFADHSRQADQLVLYNDLVYLLKELPPDYRIVFNLYVIDGYTHPEIAEMMDISVGTSKSTLSRARALLQKRILKIEEEKAWRI